MWVTARTDWWGAAGARRVELSGNRIRSAMCGIFGIVADPAHLPTRASVLEALAPLASRGPDNEGVWIDGVVAFGHRRLAVLDPTAVGDQPMSSADGRYVIVLNGEIYNFRELRQQVPAPVGGWRTRTDTEVVIECYRRWGAACVERFRGMFALAIWDRENRSLFLARDRLGVKPLYVADTGSELMFASRPSALLATGRVDASVDPQALRLYLEAGFIPSPWSLHKGIRKLQPGCTLTLQDGRRSEGRYWDVAAIAPDPALAARSETHLLDDLDALIDRSVHARLVSDVPLGVFLSGGVDSTLVARAMKRHAETVRAFTIGFDEEAFDESRYATDVATRLGCKISVEMLGPEDLLALVPRYLEAYDEPLFDSSAFAVMALARGARREVTVALSGDGGDEFFGGYHYYPLMQKLASLYRMPGAMRRSLAAVVKQVPNHRMQLGAGALAQRDPLAAFGFARSVSKDFGPMCEPDVTQHTFGFSDLLREAAGRLPSGLTAAEQAMRLDAMYTLPDDYLQKTDVGTMAFSLEAREPLLDHELVEWALRLPTSWKLRNDRTKWLPRRLMERSVGKTHAQRAKQGFSVPIDAWLRGPLKQWAEHLLLESPALERLGLDRGRVRRALDLHATRARQVHPLLWGLLVLLSHEDQASRPAVSA